MLLSYLRKCEFDAQFERLCNQNSLDEDYEARDLIKDYSADIIILNDVKSLDLSHPQDALYEFDVITRDEYIADKTSANIPQALDNLLRSYYMFELSIYHQDAWDFLDRFEEELFDQLSNIEQKNYCSICYDGWDALDIESLKRLNYELHNRYQEEIATHMLKSSIKVDIIDKMTILKRFRDIYEPDWDDLFDLADRINIQIGNLPDFIESLNGWLKWFYFNDGDGNPSDDDYSASIIIDCVLGCD